jgi:hypothetical protein
MLLHGIIYGSRIPIRSNLEVRYEKENSSYFIIDCASITERM